MLRFACRLAVTAVNKGSSVYVHAPSPAKAQEFNELFWSYPPKRMIPHGILGTAEAIAAPVVIGSGSVLGQGVVVNGLLINLTDEAPAFVARFDRAAEIIVEQTRASGRARYLHYRAQSHELAHHEIGDWEGT